MKRFFISILTIAIFLLFFVSCYYDNEEALYPTLSNACDTTNVTFSGTIASILSNNCHSCHSNANAAFGGGIHLQSIADIITNSSKIVVSIKQTGSKPMPPGGKLSSCSITQFDIWVRNGMPNN
jgi:cytochrome c5